MSSILERNKKVSPAVKKTREEYAEDALYREVWEDVNNEKTLNFIKKYYRYITGAIIVILLISVGIQFGMRTYRANKVATAMNYESALENADAHALASLGKNTSGVTADLALFQSYVLDKNIDNLKYLAENGKTRDLRDLARIHYIYAKGDDMSAQDVEHYLSDLNTKKSPYYYTSRMIVAQKYLSVGDRTNANTWLDKIISDKDAPATISAVASTLR